jgi:hypothetical protein
MCRLFSTEGGIHSTSISRGWANDRDRVPQRGEPNPDRNLATKSGRAKLPNAGSEPADKVVVIFRVYERGTFVQMAAALRCGREAGELNNFAATHITNKCYVTALWPPVLANGQESTFYGHPTGRGPTMPTNGCGRITSSWGRCCGWSEAWPAAQPAMAAAMEAWGRRRPRRSGWRDVGAPWSAQSTNSGEEAAGG